ncbi:hypothetical protein K435DRAFT_744436 [Dendrothele bispora CBS 962.96]|uniref:Dienelactone hydrolase domain-containing protein n=1 Tax=Dendrothele bispora (strain CBS 962.96) TaxID=1314807 RepID=A0A4S8MUM0_DENBC|nr:hypothetical protein K435DRAFT_744436 [Dendrothele bispora CBS 962.96]
MTTHNTNQACCSIPPVQSDYSPVGSFKPLGKFNKVYVTGPATSTNAIICVYDIFGHAPIERTQQGADLLAKTLDTTVYMPDFFEPEGPFPIDNFPPTTDEAKQELQNFFGGIANPPETVKKLTAFGELLKSNGAKKIGVYGFCWGGKVTISAGGEGTPFSAVSIVHPAMLSGSDAEKLTVPLAMYISKDEPVDEYEKIIKSLENKPFTSQCDYKNYTNMFHGWAAARGDLKNEENKKEYEEVYNKLANFFKKTLA